MAASAVDLIIELCDTQAAAVAVPAPYTELEKNLKSIT